MTAATTASKALVDDLVSANHILFVEGVVDGFGHVSVRHDRRDDRFLLACGVAPATVTADDIVEVDYDGTVHDAAGRRSYLERFIHSEIYKARPDVMAIVHSHSPAIIPFGVTRATLRPPARISRESESVPSSSHRSSGSSSARTPWSTRASTITPTPSCRMPARACCVAGPTVSVSSCSWSIRTAPTRARRP